jgi:hypothetical protein
MLLHVSLNLARQLRNPRSYLRFSEKHRVELVGEVVGIH